MRIDLATFWWPWVYSVHFCVFCVFLCLEAIVNQKGEHVFFVDSCMFSKDFQGPQGTENQQFDQQLTSWDMPFFGRRVGSRFGTLWVPKINKLVTTKTIKTKVIFGGPQGRSWGGDFVQGANSQPGQSHGGG